MGEPDASVLRFAAITTARLTKPLTPAEAQVLYLRIDRLMDPQTIEELTHHYGCVYAHLASAYRKLGFHRKRGEKGWTLAAVLAFYWYECGKRDAAG